LRGTPAGRFEEVLPRGGTKAPLVHTSRAAAFGDIDNDGGVDVLVLNRDAPPYLLWNIVPNRGHWIMLRVLEEHGRDALGATVTMQAGSRTITADVRSASSYCAANDPRIHIGLGPETRVTGVSVRWPDGARERFGDLPAGAILTLRRGAGAP
jgi:enediyne biosynthesis protein E4